MFGLFADAVVSSSGRRRKVEDKSDCLLSSILGGTIQCACNRSADEVFGERVAAVRAKGPWRRKAAADPERGRPLPCYVPEVDPLLKIRCCTPSSSRWHAAVVIKLNHHTAIIITATIITIIIIIITTINFALLLFSFLRLLLRLLLILYDYYIILLF